MNPTALPPALFTAAPPPAQPSATAAGNNNPPSQARFSQMLGSTEAAAADDSPAAMGDPIPSGADTSDAADEGDAPWPPAGLETLLAAPPSSPAPAMATPLPAAPLGAAMNPSLGDARALLAADGGQTASGNGLTVGAGLPLAKAALATDAEVPLAMPEQGSTELMQVLNPTTPVGAAVSLPGIDAGAIATMAAVGASAGASPVPSQDSQAAVLPTRADMGGEHFDADVAQGVEYMLDNKLQTARIRISPQQLGMIEIELRLDGDRVHANFSSTQADVRQALQDSLPRLREMLDAHGMQMGQAAVNDNPAGQQQRPDSAQHTAQGSAAPGGDGEPSAGTAATPVWRHNRLLDTYA